MDSDSRSRNEWPADLWVALLTCPAVRFTTRESASNAGRLALRPKLPRRDLQSLAPGFPFIAIPGNGLRQLFALGNETH